MKEKVSIIMPAYNAEEYIKEAISSVINQEYANWELLIIDDGSTDKTKDIIKEVNDLRIRYFEQQHQGVSAARNIGLLNMKGKYFCFLDADDVLPPKSLKARLDVFERDSSLAFVDGKVLYRDKTMTLTLKKFIPSFKGKPYDELLKINNHCLFGNTWMIKNEQREKYRFNEEMTHAEDLYFYLTISKDKKYSFTTEEILHYRITHSSAMSNLKGLEDGYFKLYKNVESFLYPRKIQLLYLKYRLTRIMVLSHLFNGKNLEAAIKVFFRYLRA